MGVMTDDVPSVTETILSSESWSPSTIQSHDLTAEKTAGSNDIVLVSTKGLEHQGADLLLSLAETASEHAKHQSNGIDDYNGMQGDIKSSPADRNNMTELPNMSELSDRDTLFSKTPDGKVTVISNEISPNDTDLNGLSSKGDIYEPISKYQSSTSAYSAEAIITPLVTQSEPTSEKNVFSFLKTTPVEVVEQNYTDLSLHPNGLSFENVQPTGSCSSPAIHTKRLDCINDLQEIQEQDVKALCLNSSTGNSSIDSSKRKIDSRPSQESSVVEAKVIISPSSSNERSEDGDDHNSESTAARRKKRKTDSTNVNDNDASVPKNAEEQTDAKFRQTHLHSFTHAHPSAAFFPRVPNNVRPPMPPPTYMYVAPPFPPGPHFAYTHSPASPYLAPSYFHSPSMYSSRIGQPNSLPHMYAATPIYPPRSMYSSVTQSKGSSSVIEGANTQPSTSPRTKTEGNTKKNVAKETSSPGLAPTGKLRCVALKNPVSSSSSLR
jgi:hypothetical protein